MDETTDTLTPLSDDDIAELLEGIGTMPTDEELAACDV